MHTHSLTIQTSKSVSSIDFPTTGPINQHVPKIFNYYYSDKQQEGRLLKDTKEKNLNNR